MENLYWNMILSYLQTLWPALLGLAIPIFWMRGYFGAYAKVRTSRGKYTLVKEYFVDKIHYHVAEITKDSNLVWGKEGNKKEPRVILNNMEKDYTYKEMNVECVNVDGRTHAFLPPDLTAKNIQLIKQIQADNKLTQEQRYELYKNIYNAIEGFDPEIVDSLIVAAKYKPSILNNNIKLVLIGMIVLFIAQIAIGFLVYQQNKGVNGLFGDIQAIKAGVSACSTLAGHPAAIPTGALQ